MRTNRGWTADSDSDMEYSGRSMRRIKSGAADLDEAREAWEPIVCPACGAEHPDTLSVRLKRSGRQVQARCSDCGAVAARYASGVWTS